jgi:hypothetical protein
MYDSMESNEGVAGLSSAVSYSSSQSSFAFKQKSPNTWTVDDVCDWLRSFGFDKFVESFREEHISGDFLMAHLQDREVMEDLGVTKNVQMKRLEFELNKFTVPVPPMSIVNESAVPNRSLPIPKERSRKVLQEKSTEEDDDEKVAEDAGIESDLIPLRRSNRRKYGDTPRYREPEDIDIEEDQEEEPTNRPKKAKATPTKRTSTDHDLENDEPVEFQREIVPSICFQEAKSAKAKCRGCEVRIERGLMKLGLRTFYVARGTVFPTSGWYHLQCGISVTSTKDPLVIQGVEAVCKSCKNKILTTPSPEETLDGDFRAELEEKLVVLGGKPSKRDFLCQLCVEDSLISPMNEGLSRDCITQLPGYEALSKTMQDKVRFMFRCRNIFDVDDGE